MQPCLRPDVGGVQSWVKSKAKARDLGHHTNDPVPQYKDTKSHDMSFPTTGLNTRCSGWARKRRPGAGAARDSPHPYIIPEKLGRTRLWNAKPRPSSTSWVLDNVFDCNSGVFVSSTRRVDRQQAETACRVQLKTVTVVSKQVSLAWFFATDLNERRQYSTREHQLWARHRQQQ